MSANSPTSDSNFVHISESNWRVTISDSRPSVNLDPLYEGIRHQLADLGVPVNVDLVQITTGGKQERRVRIRHQDSTYSLYHILVGLQDFGRFVFASQYNWLVEPPKRPSRPEGLSSPDFPMPALWAVGIGLIMFFSGFGLGVGVVLVGLVVAGAGGWFIKSYVDKNNEYKATKSDYDGKVSKWSKESSEYFAKVDRIFLDRFDNNLYHLTNSTEEIVELVLKSIYPTSDKTTRDEVNHVEKARRELLERRQQFSGDKELKGISGRA